MARRHRLDVTLVSNAVLRVPAEEGIALVVVKEGFDGADDWIVEHVGRDDIVVSSDIPLAFRCIEKGARVLGPTGKPFTDDNIGEALATRNLLSELRASGVMMGGPPPFQKRDRSRFLQILDTTIRGIVGDRQRPSLALGGRGPEDK